MFLKIIWENDGETIVDCSRVRVSPVWLNNGEVKEGDRTVMFESIAENGRSPGGPFLVGPKDLVQVFIMNDKGATIENWHSDRRAALCRGVSAPYGEPSTVLAG